MRLQKFVPLLLLASLLFIVFNVSAADEYTYLYSLPVPQEETRNYVLSGNTAVVTIEDEGTIFNNTVKVYISTAAGWIEQATLTPDREIEPYLVYGQALAIHGDLAVVSTSGYCPRYEDEPPETPASTFIFKRTGTTWTQQQEIQQSCSAGDEVDIDGTTLAISDSGGYDNYYGSISFFEYNGTSWVAAGGAELDDAGTGGSRDSGSVAIEGDTAVVIGEAEFSGDVIRVLKRSGGIWSLQTTMPQTTPIAEQNIDFDGNTAIFGNLVYVLSGSTWTLQQTLESPNGFTQYTYIQVAVEGDNAILSVDAYNVNNPSASTKNTYLYTRAGTTWTPVELLVNGQSIEGSPDISGNLALVGPYTFRINDVPVSPTPTPIVTQEQTPPPTLTPVVTEEPTSDPDATPTPTATVPTAAEQLNINPGFEDGSSLIGWTLKNASGDKRVCDSAKNVAHSGSCAFKFRNGENDSAKLQQKLNLSGETGSLTLSLFALTKGGATGNARVVIKYADASKQSFDVDLTGANVYTEFSQSAALEQSGNAKAKITIKGTNPQGKFYVDNVTLRYGDTSGLNLLPLPAN